MNINNLNRDFDNAIKFLKKYKSTDGSIPFIHSFPKNCCEVVSFFFAQAMAHKYQESDIFIVHGYNKTKSVSHFWVVLDDIVLDLTAHQFHKINSPIICHHKNPLESRFPICEFKKINDENYSNNFLNISDVARKLFLQELLDALL
jgi:hypothetical protein